MKPSVRILLVLSLFLVATPSRPADSGPADRSPAAEAMKLIRPEAIRASMRFLSDGLLEGRAPDGRGYDIAARYVAARMEAMGLRPAGTGGGWFQPVSLRKAVLDAQQSSVVLIGDGKEETLADAVDYIASGDALRLETSVEAPVVFVGFGVTAPELNHDDYEGADVRGKIVVAFRGAPARFPSTERAYFTDGTLKAKNAVAHGAIGALGITLPEEDARYPWKWIVPQVQAGSMRWLDVQGVPHNTFPELRGAARLSQGGAGQLFAGAPKSLEEVFAAAGAGRPQSFPLKVKARIRQVSRHTDFHSSNIIGVLPGADPALRDQYVVYTAHVDHLGLCPPAEGDNVCHGTLDNASGTAALLEIAQAFASLRPAPRRSLLFVFVTGEEKGLLGSDYFAQNPTVPRKAIVANLNIDGAPGILYPMRDIVALGIEHSSLARDVNEAAHEMGYAITPDPVPEEVSFIRSDQYSFVLQGVPAVSITEGITSTNPKIDGLKVMKEWLLTRYHTPRDSMDQPMDFESAARGARLNFLAGYKVAQRAAAPAWNQGDFFGMKFGRK